MYQIHEGQVMRNKYSSIPYKWIQNEYSNRTICIMLPGLGYTTERPLFHYATGLCLERNIDVLHINYTFAKNEQFRKLSKQEQPQWMYEDVKAVVEEVLKETEYECCILLSKSIGTIPMSMEWSKRYFIRNAIGIWLTPLLKEQSVYEALLHTNLPSLCVIGDQDHHFIEERIHSLKANNLISTVVVPNADHSLEIKEDTIASIDAVKTVMLNAKKFLVKHRKGAN
ncbi:alpha/beta family hydrolase [Neobacillus cucumis]|uniref:Alpha/beta hydrolase n=1 Tax=Neobacillus cucumis TaxID=1740721 RepID=A0A2N5HC66_9BACI|nr:alpha/beta family hydrolase [Neobacillus cucumis]PLS03100.1 alpha/beta hydrolase [Neobacillus cucumis]